VCGYPDDSEIGSKVLRLGAAHRGIMIYQCVRRYWPHTNTLDQISYWTGGRGRRARPSGRARGLHRFGLRDPTESARRRRGRAAATAALRRGRGPGPSLGGAGRGGAGQKQATASACGGGAAVPGSSPARAAACGRCRSPAPKRRRQRRPRCGAARGCQRACRGRQGRADSAH
jgi:hypothetical protein